jgi:hypothetical protein
MRVLLLNLGMDSTREVKQATAYGKSIREYNQKKRAG